MKATVNPDALSPHTEDESLTWVLATVIDRELGIIDLDASGRDCAVVGGWVGRNVALYPGDTYVRHAHVLDVDEHGWEFEILNTGHTGNQPGWCVGDRLYVSHSKALSLAELAEDEG